MVGVQVRPLAIVIAMALAGGVALAGCGRRVFHRDERAGRLACVGRGPAHQPGGLSGRISAADVALRVPSTPGGRRGDRRSGTPPRPVVQRALYVERALHLLSRHPSLAASTIRRLPTRLARETRELTAALRDLRRLSAGWPAQAVRHGPAKPLGKLLAYYRAAQRRFGLGWQVLAAVNLVESAFGRVRTDSVAGARGPMQFMPPTWRAYGLGGDIRDPRDAILGAANLLRQAGAPGSYTRALYAYNPSPLYVDAVRRYARLIARDRDAVYFLYSWRVLTPAQAGEHRPAGSKEASRR